MLTLTDTATTVVRDIVDQNTDAETATGGLRIDGATEGPTDFTVSVVTEPTPGDAVVEDAGARVFLDETASVALDDKVLDARVGEGGAVSFAITSQS